MSLENIVQEARQKCEAPIDDCKSNAKFLSNFIQENTEYNTRIIKGGINYDKEPTPETYEEAKRDGTLHHWVLVEKNGKDFHCDICMEVPSYEHNKYGSILVSSEKPEHYIIFNS